MNDKTNKQPLLQGGLGGAKSRLEKIKLEYTTVEDFRPQRYAMRKSWWLCECPLCNTRHLEVNSENGRYHCFYAGCNFHGTLAPSHPSRGKEPVNTQKESKALVPVNAGPMKGYSKLRLIDFKPVPQEKMNILSPISVNPDEDNADQLWAREYLEKCHISYEVAAESGVMLGSINGYLALGYVNWIEGRPVNIKIRSISKSGKNDVAKDSLGYDKEFTQVSPNKEHLPAYWLAPQTSDLSPQTSGLIIVEGEKDALMLRSMGYYPVASLPSGADSDVRLAFEAFMPWIEKMDRVILCGDRDQPGRIAIQHEATYFGRKAWLAEWPDDLHCKDITEVRQKLGEDKVREIISSACRISDSTIITPSARKQQIIDRAYGNYDHGYSVGYGPLTDRVLHLGNEGGLIIVTGKPNSGKTDFLNDLMCHLMFKCQKSVAFLSFELPDKDMHMTRLLRLVMGKYNLGHTNQDVLSSAIDRMNDYMVELDLGTSEPKPSLIISYAEDILRERRKLDFLVIDPFLFLVLDQKRQTSETQAITNALREIQQWARSKGVWVVIVAHPRKLSKKYDGSNDFEDIDFYSINGSAAWANLADFLFSIERVQPKALDVTTISPVAPHTYTKLSMLKVRNQDFCSVGDVAYIRQRCGRYDERALSNEADRNRLYDELKGTIYGTTDKLPWL